MSKIYSRSRIRIPRLKSMDYDNKKAKKIFKILVILIIAMSTFKTTSKAISSIYEGLCNEKVTHIATEIINSEVSRVLLEYDYKDLVTVIKNEEDNTNILKTDVVIINKITSELPMAIETRFQALEKEKIVIPIGALTGNTYLAGMGPKTNIKVIQTGNILTEVKTEFESAGINQTIYRIYLELRGVVNILTPYNTISKEIVNQVLLVETVIVGDVPQTYLNMDGINVTNPSKIED